MNLKVGMKFDKFDDKKWELFKRLSQDVFDGDMEAELVVSDLMEESGVTHLDMFSKETDSTFRKLLNFWSTPKQNRLPNGLRVLLADLEAEDEERRKVQDAFVPQCICNTDEWWNCRAFKHKETDIFRVEYLGEFKSE